MTRWLAEQTWLCVAGLVASGWVAAAHGQGNTFNPYGNSGYADYREFTTPMYSNDPSLPNQARLQGGMFGGSGRANQFEQYTQSLDGSNADALNSNRGVRNGVPYYQAYRLYDKSNKRVYKANETVDREFLAKLNKRDEDYQKALAEKDPNKRALMIQRIERNALAQPARAATSKSGAAAKEKTAKTPASAARILDPPLTRRPAATPARPAPPAVATPTPAPEPAAISPPVPVVNPSAVPIPAPG